MANTPVFDESVVVESMLNNEETNADTLIEASSPSLTKVTMGEITTFLAKSGFQVSNFFDFHPCLLQGVRFNLTFLSTRLKSTFFDQNC